MGKSLILGAGTYGQVYAEYLKESKKYDIIGFLDDDPEKIGLTFHGVEVLDTVSNLYKFKNSSVKNIFAPIGNNILRRRFLNQAQEIGFNTPSFLHSHANIHSSVTLGNVVYILPGTNIMPFTSIGEYVMISMGVNIAHHVHLKSGVFLSQGSNIGASINIYEDAFIGISATIMTGVNTVGKNSVIGAGACVIHDIPENCTAVGVPAKPIKFHNE